MGILLALIAGMFTPLTNLCIRKSVDVGSSAKAFFVFQMTASFLFALLLGPIRTAEYVIPLSTAAFGAIAGLVLSVMLFALGKAVEQGPPGFTFAILNSATVMPGLIMALVFGAALGFVYNIWHAIGSVIVLGGLFWGAKGLQGVKNLKSWAFFAFITFSFHVFLLALFQGRAMLINPARPESFASFLSLAESKSEWFTPFMFLTSGIIQLFIYFKAKQQAPRAKEVLYGCMGGLFNLLCTFFLIWATEKATPLENAIIFPIYSVIGIILTNFWGQKLYQEQVNWRACQICAFGLFIGTVDWKSVIAAIGL
jgi:drug/metabolite transporter (DMT)-like permease